MSDPVGAFGRAHRTGRLVALQTSGTAGPRRTVVRTTASWVDSFPHVSRLLDLDATSRVWIPGPPAATMNLFAAVHADWAGATRSDTPRTATHACLTPSALRRELGRRPDELAALHVLVAGDRLDRRAFEDAVDSGVRVSHYYGAAELSFVAWGEHAEALRPFPGVEVCVRAGEIWARSPYLCQGRLPGEPSVRRDDEGWMTVGDLGTLSEGRVRVDGRAGGITTGGATVLVAEVELVLRSHAVGQVVVVGFPHPDLGEVVAAVVSEQEDLARLRTLARMVLAPAQRPRRWLHVSPFPLTDIGKVDRQALAATMRAGAQR
jgi:acyl-CoA synthetase (AMP-forming)/AMP-acid ligase II